jgi:hypothetical protein
VLQAAFFSSPGFGLKILPLGRRIIALAGYSKEDLEEANQSWSEMQEQRKSSTTDLAAVVSADDDLN